MSLLMVMAIFLNPNQNRVIACLIKINEYFFFFLFVLNFSKNAFLIIFLNTFLHFLPFKHPSIIVYGDEFKIEIEKFI